MPIKEGFITESQAIQVAASHNGRSVCAKTVTNLRGVLGAEKTASGKFIYPLKSVMEKWPRGKYRTDARSAECKDMIVANADFKFDGKTSGLHFHNCNVTVHVHNYGENQ